MHVIWVRRLKAREAAAENEMRVAGLYMGVGEKGKPNNIVTFLFVYFG